jgi:hypothetical protein
MLKSVRKTSVLLICVAAAALAATKPDFSGTYAAQQKNDSKATAASVVLRVVESDSAVEVTRVYGDKSTTNRFPLDGSEGDYTTETGARGKCKAQMKNETLVLESLVASAAGANRPSIRFHVTEQWRLSSDSSTLNIKTEIQSPDMPPDVIAAAFPNNPRTEKYHRTDKP